MAISDRYSVTINNTISDISVNVITITEDRLENVLIKHVDKLRRSKDYVGAIALSVSLLIVLVTSDFKNKWLDAGTWRGFFIFLFIASIGYLGYTLYNLIRNNDSVEDIMKDIKRST